ncbi:Ig-like domain-containing protein [Barnesiella viscericola]|uniref:Ig-like domain-containing protein n=1 Tax=Barnesiella viscericola TaxID=397865 RepID=UPI002352F14B|nr:Ig-like domain-containing protein [Barnesiella viscericola]
MLEVSSLSAGISIKAGSATTYITQIEVTPTGGTSLQDPALAFTGITGDVTKLLTDGSYSSVATSASDATIVYSSSDHEVATINQEGLVTLVGSGTTTIKAEVAETATYDAAFVEYTLKVVDPALVKTFTKVTNGSVTDGQYIIVYQESDEATSVMAMNTTNTENYFEYSEIDLTEGKIVTDDQSIIWDITTESDGNYSVSNNGIYVAYNGSNATSGGNNAYADDAYSTERAGWKIEYDSENHVFLFKNAKVDTRILQFNTNANQGRFACYRSAQGKITLYKLDEGPATGVENVDVANGMKIINGKGQVTIETTEAARVAVYALTGAQVRQLDLVEGTNVVELPAGIYVIGRQKVIVF